MAESFWPGNRRPIAQASRAALAAASRRRRLRLEFLEDRSLLAALPFGAMPDDTGEFLLGDVLVSVVLMESDSSLSPFDASTEDWNTSLIADVKQRIVEGLNWWTQTLDGIEEVRDGLLSFTIDWTYLNSPVKTGYEPITRVSGDFGLWVHDFLDTAGFNQAGDFLTNLRAFNNAQRIAHQKHWAFTIFVVNNAQELAGGGDGKFSTGPNGFYDPGEFPLSFAYAGGHAFVMPADRPAASVAHETGHMFWALDEYNRTANSYNNSRGYYNTQNANANPDPQYQPQDSIMSSGQSLAAAWVGHTSSTSSLEMVGWKDSDSDGIFDVLDVNFSLAGSAHYNLPTETFRFVGRSAVRTLPNKNPAGLQSDITINEIRQAQYKIDEGQWETVANYQAYQVDLDVSFIVPSSASTVRLRTIDTRTGVTSDEYVYSLSGSPGQRTPGPGLGGFVFNDPDNDGQFDLGDFGLRGFSIGLVDLMGSPLDLRRWAEPDQFNPGQVLDSGNTGAILTGVGGDVSSSQIRSTESSSAPGAGQVFGVSSALTGGHVDTFSGSRHLRAEFTSPVTSVSIRAYGVSRCSVARMEAYSATGQLLARVTTSVLAAGQSEELSIDRPAAEIAFVLVKGHGKTEVVLDNLQWGAISSTTTDVLGAWSLPTLPAGTYRIAVTLQTHYEQTSPEQAFQQVTVDAMGSMAADFLLHRIANPWRNNTNPLDVNQDGVVTPRDALAVINHLNAHGSGGSQLEESEGSSYLLDVNDDGAATPTDALMVINELNRRALPPLPDLGGGGTTLHSSSSASSAEGEDAGSVSTGPELAARYYASSPLHASSIPGVDPTSGGCTCGQCQTIAEVAQARVGASSGEENSASGGDVGPHLDLTLLSILADDCDTSDKKRRRGG